MLALSVPFWVIGAATERELLPGLPLSALMAFCPAIAASILVYREQGSSGVAQLLRRAFDLRRIERKVWYIPILGLMPLVLVVSYWLMRRMGVSLPTPAISFLRLPMMFIGFLAAALGEELGWSGYATDPMQTRWGALAAGIILGLVWASWHLVPLLQAHRSVEWIAGWSLGTVANRVIIVWLYNMTGRSVFAAALYHTMSNLSWQLFPRHGSHYDPRVSGPVIALAAAIIVGRTVARARSTKRVGIPQSIV